MINTKPKRGRPPQGGQSKTSITIRLEPALLANIKQAANKQKVPYQTYLQDVLRKYVSTEKRSDIVKEDSTVSGNHNRLTTLDLYLKTAKESRSVVSSHKGKNGAVFLGAGDANFNRIVLLLNTFYIQITEKIDEKWRDKNLKRKDNTPTLMTLRQVRESIESIRKKCSLTRKDLLRINDLRAKVFDEILLLLDEIVSQKKFAEEQVKILHVTKKVSEELVNRLGPCCSSKNISDFATELKNISKIIIEEHLKKIAPLTSAHEQIMVEHYKLAIKKASQNKPKSDQK